MKGRNDISCMLITSYTLIPILLPVIATAKRLPPSEKDTAVHPLGYFLNSASYESRTKNILSDSLKPIARIREVGCREKQVGNYGKVYENRKLSRSKEESRDFASMGEYV
jgi:hypothetical protein